MKKLFCLPLFIVTASCTFAQSDPIIEGKPESYWVDQLTNNLQSYDFQSKVPNLETNRMAVLIKAVEKMMGQTRL
jgi:hypothetical protein